MMGVGFLPKDTLFGILDRLVGSRGHGCMGGKTS